jgi:hypothetical protein
MIIWIKNFAICLSTDFWCGNLSNYRPLIVLLDLCDLMGLYYSNGFVHALVKPVSILFWVELLFILACVGSSPPLVVAGRRWASTSASLASGPGAVWSLAAGCRIPRPFNLPPPCPQSAHTGARGVGCRGCRRAPAARTALHRLGSRITRFFFVSSHVY